MRITIIVFAVIAVLALGLLGVTFVLRNFEGLASGEGQIEEAVPGRVAMEGLAVPISFEGVLVHTVTIDFYMHIAHGEREAEVRAILPRIRDAILRDVHRTSVSRADVGTIDLVRFKERVAAAANQVLHAEEVDSVQVTRVALLQG